MERNLAILSVYFLKVWVQILEWGGGGSGQLTANYHCRAHLCTCAGRFFPLCKVIFKGPSKRKGPDPQEAPLDPPLYRFAMTSQIQACMYFLRKKHVGALNQRVKGPV